MGTECRPTEKSHLVIGLNTYVQNLSQLAQKCTDVRKKRNPSRLLGVEVEFKGLAHGETEFVCSKTAALADAPD